MRRKLSALLGVVVAMLLSLVLVVPANAATSAPKPMPVDPRFKYGMDYYYKEIFSPTGTNPVDKPPGWRVVDVPVKVNPSNVTDTRLRPSGTMNKPLVGKIITPGQTLMKPPSVYAPTQAFKAAGALGLGRLLGASGFGIGGVTEAPSNWKDIARTKVSAGCNVDTNAGCTGSDFNQILAVTNCSHTSSCVALGAKDSAGNPITNDANWFKDTAVPFLKNLWSALTGQGQSSDVALVSQTHVVIADPRGCFRQVASFTPDAAGSGGTITATGTVTHPKPTNTSSFEYTYWGRGCDSLTATTNLVGSWESTCQDASGNFQDGSGLLGMKGSLGGSNGWDTAGHRTTFCRGGSLVSVRFYNGLTQAYFDSTTSAYAALQYFEWINPDPGFDTIDHTKFTTTTDCRTPDGAIHTFSSTVEKLAAFAEPSCPVGSDLVRHDVVADDGMKTATVDSGGEVPGTATKYPTCTSGTGCALTVWVDGALCTTAFTDCQNWVAVAGASPGRVQCKWGTNVMPLSDCYVIAEGYKPKSIGVVLDPRSGSWVSVDTAGVPAPLSPAPWNPTNPTPVAGGDPGTAPAADPGTGTGTNTGGFPSTGVSPADGCVSPAWSWNPVDWVKSPVVCALKEAFVPKTDIQAKSNALRDKALGTAPLGWAINPPIAGPSGGSCPNWVINVGDLHENVVCESSFTAAIVGARGPMFGIVASAMMWPLLRSIWYALIPIVRVSPSGSK